jgi:competence protein ComGC
MKKIIVLLTLLLCLTGCTKGEEVKCSINGKKATFALKNGIISSYVLDNEKQSQSKIDEINGTYFTSSTNNTEGKTALDNYVSSLGGSCN